MTNVVLYNDKIAHLILSYSLGTEAYNAIFSIMDAFEKSLLILMILIEYIFQFVISILAI
ncbi:hypothetical protein B9N60_02780 [Campylobacter concisus]|uniref:Uncharacterized protein n=1 Tax=Campylobacter concisus TaxID=199 RepID=A0A1Y5NGR5_9BACT|nr:hypothetical protein B9N60_02780 [Campylobacter concisus]